MAEYLQLAEALQRSGEVKSGPWRVHVAHMAQHRQDVFGIIANQMSYIWRKKPFIAGARASEYTVQSEERFLGRSLSSTQASLSLGPAAVD